MKKPVFVYALLILVLVPIVSYSQSSELSTMINASSSSNPVQNSSLTVSSTDLHRFNLGEFINPSRDEEIHYIKVEIEIGYLGKNDEALVKNKEKMRDIVNNHFRKLTIQRAKEDYVDGFLHKDLEKKLSEYINETAPGLIKVITIYIPSFIIN